MSRRPDRPRVLLLWPGGLFGGGSNFGVPQLLSIARAIELGSDALVEVIDLDMERAFGTVDLGALLSPGYDIVGISCYSSFDYLKVMEIGALVRAALPDAWLVTGGYHPSARPSEFTGTDSPFDYVVVGDGERPMARLAAALSSGKRPLTRVLGPDPVPDPGELVPYDWQRLARYRPIARKMASQAEIYLSRGCPYDCAFCMERAKRDVSWRALTPEHAVEEMHRLDQFLDLSRWTLFVADALFGMKQRWRKEFLAELARRPIRARKVWLLIRVDLIDREDLELMARANVGPGFGLESGDPSQLKRIRKAGKLESYLDKMVTVSEWARELNVPFGANIIVGHPGETEQTLRASADYMKRLFLGPRGTHGFLSVDPFRLYPGSPIDEERGRWESDTGMRAHRYPWWHDGDQEFLSEWVDPSASLDFRRTHRLRHELFAPIVGEIKRRFAYDGPARDYYMRAVDEQVDLVQPSRQLHTLGLWHLWTRLTKGASSEAVASDAELRQTARLSRQETLDQRGVEASARVTSALVEVPRERFVRLEDIGASADDRPLALTDDHASTISALHAYAKLFDAVDLSEGETLVELGSGTGYGAALASEVVGAAGSVLTLEIDPELASQASKNLADRPNVRAVQGDAHDVDLWAGASKVVCTFAVESIPERWVEALRLGGRLVAPVDAGDHQELVCVERRDDGRRIQQLEPVRYVADRGSPRPTPPR